VTDAASQLARLVKDFYDRFPTYFNGAAVNPFTQPRTSMDALKATPRVNVAVVRKGDRNYLGFDTLRFVVDQNAELFTPPGGVGIPLPDFHPDWVAVIKQREGIGFAVQTLQRYFFETGDIEAYAIEAAVEATAPELASFIIGFNAYHFLAGRRSWRIGLVNDELPGWKLNQQSRDARTGTATTFVADPILYLETAAIERSSKGLYALLEYDPGFVMNLRDYLSTIWITLLNNYVAIRGYDMDGRKPTVWQTDDGDAQWTLGERSKVWYRTGSFESLQVANQSTWVQSVLQLHPDLAQ
jgi:hypothetical protein